MFHHGFMATDRKESRLAKRLVAEYALVAIQSAKDQFWGPNTIARLAIGLKFFGARQNADLDNLYKLVLDACQGVLFKNDSQVDMAQITRHVCKKGEERTEVSISPLSV